jgi:hypothetical protein
VVHGYPHALAGIDYEARVIQYRGQTLSAKYDCKESEPGMHAITFPDPSAVFPPNGMSGSPVFRIFIDKASADRPFHIYLAGILCTGNKHRARFLDLMTVLERMRRLSAELGP